MHPQLDFADELIRVFGYPAIIGAIVWASRKWDKWQQEFKIIRESTETAVAKISVVESEVNTIKTNHLAHLQDGIIRLAESNDKAVVYLQTISTGIAVLADREKRS